MDVFALHQLNCHMVKLAASRILFLSVWYFSLGSLREKVIKLPFLSHCRTPTTAVKPPMTLQSQLSLQVCLTAASRNPTEISCWCVSEERLWRKWGSGGEWLPIQWSYKLSTNAKKTTHLTERRLQWAICLCRGCDQAYSATPQASDRRKAYLKHKTTLGSGLHICKAKPKL